MVTIFPSRSVVRFILVSVLLLLLAGCSSREGEHAPSLPKNTQWVNKIGKVHLEDFRGKPLLMVFLTDQCPGCAQLAPVLNKLQQNQGTQVNFIGIFLPHAGKKIDVASARSEMLKYRIKFPVAVDVKATIHDQYHISGWPTVIIVDQSGKIKKIVYGPRPLKYFVQILRQMS